MVEKCELVVWSFPIRKNNSLKQISKIGNKTKTLRLCRLALIILADICARFDTLVLYIALIGFQPSKKTTFY